MHRTWQHDESTLIKVSVHNMNSAWVRYSKWGQLASQEMGGSCLYVTLLLWGKNHHQEKLLYTFQSKKSGEKELMKR